MSSKVLFQLSGFALLVALPLQVLGYVLHPPSERVIDVLDPMYGPSHLILFVSWLFATLGLVGLYARQAHRAGMLGLVGFALTVCAAAYHFYLPLYKAYVTVFLARGEATRALVGSDGPLAHGAGALGPLGFALVLAFPLFGIATVCADVLPRASGWLQIASVPVFILGAFVVSPDAPAPLGTMAAAPIAWLHYLLFAGYALGGYALLHRIRGSKRRSRKRSSVPSLVRSGRDRLWFRVLSGWSLLAAGVLPRARPAGFHRSTIER